MREFLDEEDVEPMPRGKRDTELTLGFGSLLGLFFALVILCGLCFGVGYEVGRGSAPSPPILSSGAPAQPSSAASKSARAQTAVSATQQAASYEATPAGQAVAASTAQPTTNYPAAQQAARPAAPRTTAQAPRAAASAPGAGYYMVQIAAVSNPEDGEVLVSALKRRGYQTSARREGDGLLHVRIGPFGTRNDAGYWRQKLLNDGYNAVVEP